MTEKIGPKESRLKEFRERPQVKAAGAKLKAGAKDKLKARAIGRVTGFKAKRGVK